MSNDRTLPVTPAERAAAPMLRAWQAWKPDMTDRGPIHDLLVAFGSAAMAAGLADALDLTPAGAALLDRVEAAERTPETVLRAMLASYEAAALLAGREWARTASEDAWGPISVHDMAGAISLIRLALAWLLESRPDPIGRFFSRALATDYEARLAGTRPLDAPPMEAP